MTLERIAGASEGTLANRILFIRGNRVMLDEDLANVYRVTVKRLNEQVKRNRRRFPADFMFRLMESESRVLRAQFPPPKLGRGGRRNRPHAFTEHGAVMLASVLNSAVAERAGIHVVRAFVGLRSVLAAHRELAQRLSELERKCDRRFSVAFEEILRLMAPPRTRRPIGFRPASAAGPGLPHGILAMTPRVRRLRR